MSRTSLFITVLIFAMIALAAWLYQSSQDEELTPWDLVSTDAVVVLDITNYAAFTQRAGSFPILASVMHQNRALHLLRVTNQKVNGLIISFHPISADDFATTIIMSANSIDLQLVDRYFATRSELTAIERTYNGSVITEYKSPNGESVSISKLDELVVLTTSPILIEGAIRLYNANSANIFRKENAKLFQLPSLQSDHGNIYINSGNLEKMLTLFTQPAQSNKNMLDFGKGALIDLKIDSSRLLLNGFVTDKNDDGFFSSFADQKPTSLDISRYISNRSAFVLEAKFSNVNDWLHTRALAFEKAQPDLFRETTKLLALHSITLEELQELTGPHLVSCFISRGAELGSVSFIKSGGKFSKLSELAFQVAEYKGDSLYREYHGDYEIQMVDLPNLLYGVAYPLLPKSLKTYFAAVDDYLVISDDVELIKLFLDDIDHEDTWGKSLEWSRFLRTTLQESNLTLYFDGRLTSLALRDILNDKWRPMVDTTRLLGIEKGAIQVSHLDAVYYLNSVLNLQHRQPKREATRVVTKFEFDRGLRLSPTVVRNHDTRELEIVVQDSLNSLMLFSKDLKKKWSVSLSGPVADKICQVDYYKNGKLQYLLATQKELYLIDRLGRSVESFPVDIPAPGVDFVREIDYDNSKNYRYLLVDKKGNAYLTDKGGKPLAGWNPRPIGQGLISAVEHRRIYGKDYFIAVQGNGTVHLMNRRGESIRGFPVSLNARPQGEFAVSRGKDLASSHLVLVSEDGQKIQVDFNGQVTRSDVLPRFSNNASFSLVKSVGGDSFVFFRIEGTRLAVIDAKNNLLFESQNTGSDQWELQFVQTSTKQSVYCLYDRQQNFSYLFNEAGTTMTASPLESDLMPTLMYDQKKQVVYALHAVGRSLSVVPILLD